MWTEVKLVIYIVDLCCDVGSTAGVISFKQIEEKTTNEHTSQELPF